MSNPCDTCQHRWGRRNEGHCYMWKSEPVVCRQYKMDRQAVLNSMKQGVPKPHSAGGSEG